jgi:hypothetical protein
MGNEATKPFGYRPRRSTKMKKIEKQKVTSLLYDTYLAVIKNSVGSRMFKNMYVKIDGKKVDATQDGQLSCAFFVSGVLTMFGLIKKTHATVSSTVTDLKASGWTEIKKPKIGCVVVWSQSDLETQGTHKHIGFYSGDKLAISNNSLRDGTPSEHPWTFNGKRKIEALFWNAKFK